MIDLREIKDKELLESYLTQNVSIFAKYFGAKIIVQKNFDQELIFFKNKNQPITDIDFIINDVYEKPVDDIRKINYLLQSDKTYHFTYDYRNDKLICNNPDDTLLCSYIINNGIIFKGALSEEMKKMFILKHTKKIIANFPNIGISMLSLIMKSDDGKNLFKVDNKNVKFSPSKFSPIQIQILEEVIESVNIDDLSRICIEKRDEPHVYIKIINKIFTKFITNSKHNWSKISKQIPDTFKPNDVAQKFQYLDDEIVKIVSDNPDTFCIYSMFISQFRKNKIFVGKNNKTINDKYTEIYNKMRDVCINNIFSTSLPPIDEILN